MEYRRFDQVCIVRLDPGEDILEEVRAVSLAEGIRLASVQGLGAVDDFTVGVFDPVEKTYQANQFQGRYEIVSLTGTVSTMNGEYYCHLHMSAGDDQGRGRRTFKPCPDQRHRRAGDYYPAWFCGPGV